MIHTFDSDIAELVGVNAAIIFQSISFWIKKNEANGENYHDGSYWTYNTKAAWKKLFPYMGDKQFKAALQKLIDEGLIKTGCYNSKPFDRTLWYALTEKGKSILPKSNSPLAQNRTMEKPRIGSPIPVNIPDNIPVTNNGEESDKASDLNTERFESFWKAYPNKKAKANARKAWDKLKVDGTLYTEIMRGLSLHKKSRDWIKDDGQFIPHPATWLNGRRWEDEVEKEPTRKAEKLTRW